ncbi:hypothetical protein [Streptomyces olivaceoviridis]|uniref:hypothetical protein n=1 Tax=Streptomyces olivaceoviridis TaxID=1921 RepID=UPI0037A1D543
MSSQPEHTTPPTTRTNHTPQQATEPAVETGKAPAPRAAEQPTAPAQSTASQKAPNGPGGPAQPATEAGTPAQAGPTPWLAPDIDLYHSVNSELREHYAAPQADPVHLTPQEVTALRAEATAEYGAALSRNTKDLAGQLVDHYLDHGLGGLPGGTLGWEIEDRHRITFEGNVPPKGTVLVKGNGIELQIDSHRFYRIHDGRLIGSADTALELTPTGRSQPTGEAHMIVEIVSSPYRIMAGEERPGVDEGIVASEKARHSLSFADKSRTPVSLASLFLESEGWTVTENGQTAIVWPAVDREGHLAYPQYTAGVPIDGGNGFLDFVEENIDTHGPEVPVGSVSSPHEERNRWRQLLSRAHDRPAEVASGSSRRRAIESSVASFGEGQDLPLAAASETDVSMASYEDGELPLLRAEYLREVEEDLGSYAELATFEGVRIEDAAKVLYARRRAIGVKYKNMTPEEKRAAIFERNLRKYGDPLGASAVASRALGLPGGMPAARQTVTLSATGLQTQTSHTQTVEADDVAMATAEVVTHPSSLVSDPEPPTGDASQGLPPGTAASSPAMHRPGETGRADQAALWRERLNSPLSDASEGTVVDSTVADSARSRAVDDGEAQRRGDLATTRRANDQRDVSTRKLADADILPFSTHQVFAPPEPARHSDSIASDTQRDAVDKVKDDNSAISTDESFAQERGAEKISAHLTEATSDFPDVIFAPGGGALDLAAKSAEAVSPRVYRERDWADLHEVVAQTLKAHRDQWPSTGDALADEKRTSLSLHELSMQKCLTLLQTLRGILYPQGIAPAYVVDDEILNGRTQRNGIIPGFDWRAVSKWDDVTRALMHETTGRGSTAFVLARRPMGLGHAFAAHVLRTADNAGEVVWIDLQNSNPADRMSTTPPRIPPTETQVVIVDGFGRIAKDSLPDYQLSTAAALVDPSESRRYGRAGAEYEFRVSIGLADDTRIYGETIARHRNGSEFKVDTNTFYRVASDIYRSLAVAQKAGRKAGISSPKKEKHVILELVLAPFSVLPSEGLQGSQTLEDALRFVSTTSRTLASAARGVTIGQVLREEEGWTVEEQFLHKEIIPLADAGNDAYTQFTIGVPVDGLLSLLRLTEARGDDSRSFALFPASRVFGMRLAEWFVRTKTGLDLSEGEINLLTVDPGVREVWGYGWLLFNHLAIRPLFHRYKLSGLFKNMLPAASRHELGYVRDVLKSDVANFFEAHAQEIEHMFLVALWEFFREIEPDIPTRPDPAALSFSLYFDEENGVDVQARDYLTYILTGRSSGWYPSHAHTLGMVHYDMDSHLGVPLALLELRHFGGKGGRMSEAESASHLRKVSEVAIACFEDHVRQGRSGRSDDLKEIVQVVQSHRHISRVSPLLEIIPELVKIAPWHRSVDSSDILFLAHSLVAVAVTGTPLAEQAGEKLGLVTREVEAALTARPLPPYLANLRMQERLQGAAEAVRNIIATQAFRTPRPLLTSSPVSGNEAARLR